MLPIPDSDVQEDIIKKVSVYESNIRKAKAIINDSAKRKQAILDKYLK